MRHFAPQVLLVLLAALFQGCSSVSYKRVTFDVLQPATYTLPSWVDTVIVVSDVKNPHITDSTVDPNNTSALSQARAGQELLPYYICKGAAEEINESGYLNARHFAGRQGMTAARIDSLLKGHSSTMILAMTGLSANTTLEGPHSGCVFMTSSTITQFTIITGPAQRYPLNERADTLLYSSCGEDIEEIVSGLPQIFDQYKERAHNTAEKTSDMLIPSWERVSRSLYVTGDKSMTSAATWVDDNNWDEARNLWIETFNTAKSNTLKAYAALNVALSFEREDDALQASMWCSKALDVMEGMTEKESKKMSSTKQRATSMFSYLMKRMEQKDLLDKQM